VSRPQRATNLVGVQRNALTKIFPVSRPGTEAIMEATVRVDDSRLDQPVATYIGEDRIRSVTIIWAVQPELVGVLGVSFLEKFSRFAGPAPKDAGTRA
jgi:hypothetical protein